MSGLGEQIAVLDGVTIAPGDGQAGGGSSYPDEGRWPLLPSSAGLRGPLGAHNDLEAFAAATYANDLPNVAPKKRVFASYAGGANYSGGSNYPDTGSFPTWAQGGPGMAGLDACGCRLNGLGTLPNVAPKKRVFASYSGGANRSGGSTYPDTASFPTWAQAGAGMAGFGAAPSAAEMSAASMMRAGVLPPGRIFASAPQGANYSGGSSFPDSGRFPLLSSTIGLAGLGAVRRMPPMTRTQVMAAIQFHSQQMVNTRTALQKVNMPPATRNQLLLAYNKNLVALCILRAKVGLPTLPECQQLVARMKAMGMAKMRMRANGGR